MLNLLENNESEQRISIFYGIITTGISDMEAELLLETFSNHSTQVANSVQKEPLKKEQIFINFLEVTS